MTKRTHLFLGAATTLFITHSPVDLICLPAAVAPDWDYIIGIKHRTITHSLLALLLTTIPIFMINERFGVLWGVNYATHLVADSFTKMGVPLLYPFCKHRFGPKILKTGDAVDLLICIVCIYFTFTLAIK